MTRVLFDHGYLGALADAKGDMHIISIDYQIFFFPRLSVNLYGALFYFSFCICA